MTTDARRSTRVTFVVLSIGTMAYSVMQSLVTPVLPTIQRQLHTSQNTATWVLTVNLLSASIFTPIFGRVGDRYGKKRMFVWALLALFVGCLLAAVTNSIGVLIVARAIQGVGGGVLPLAFGIIRDEFPREETSGAVGLAAALTSAGGGLGVVLAGPVVSVLGYHWLFWIPLVVVGGAAIAAQVLIPESPIRAEGDISVRSGLLLSAWLVALLLGVSKGTTWGWTSAPTLGLFATAVVLGLGWYVAETRTSAPLIDMHMMRRPAVWTSNLVALLMGIGMYSAFAFLPGFVQARPEVAGYGFAASTTQSCLFLVPLTFFMFVLGAVSSRLAARFGAKAVLLAGAGIGVFGYTMLAFAHAERWQIFLASAVIGCSLGLVFAAMSGVIVAAVPADQTGVATGMNANIRTIGGSIGAAVASAIITSGVAVGLPPHESGYTRGFGFLAAASVLALFAVLLIPPLRRATSVNELPHGELALVPAGTVRGSEPE